MADTAKRRTGTEQPRTGTEKPRTGTAETAEPAPGKPARLRRARAGDVAGYLAVRTLAGLFRALPVDAGSALMGAGWRLVAPRLHRHRRALDHLALALPDVPEAERRRIATAMWAHLGRVAAEALFADRLLADTARVALPPDFDRFAERAAHGAVLPTLHLGNWELAPVGPRMAGLELAAVYQPIRNPLVEAYLKAMRAPAFPAGLHPKGPATGRRLVALARRQGAIGLVADVREKRGVEVTFFGRPATATPLPALLARLGDVPMLAGAMVREKGVSFRYLVEEIEVPRTDDRDADVLIATQRLHDVFERWIRAHPEQWMWAHRKWVETAPGEGRTRPRRAAATARLPAGG